MTMTAHYTPEIMAVACPHCGRGPTQRCLKGASISQHPHVGRVRAAKGGTLPPEELNRLRAIVGLPPLLPE